MFNESGKIMLRRSVGRLLETGLLVLAVALGVGAAAAGISLLAGIRNYSNDLLSSPEYREIVVSTHGNSEDMEDPVSQKPVRETTVLTSEDLAAARVVPEISYAYIANRRMLHFINEASVAREEEMRQNMPAPPEGEGGEPGETDPFRPLMYGSEDLAEASTDETILIVELEEARGYAVSSDFFTALGLQAKAGSLFTEEDYKNPTNDILLGADLAEMITPEGKNCEDLIGKKLLARDGYFTVTGIIDTDNTSYGDSFFSPYRDGSFGGFRMPGMDTALRFSVDDPKQLEETAFLLSDWFTSLYGEGQITVSNPRAEAEQLVARNTGIGVLILFLSLTGLFIAAVNVSNMLMSRALRMKKHVGILMALGASRKKIMVLFSGEAALITGAGSLLGALLAIPLSRTMQGALDVAGVSLLYILPGVLAAAGLTMLFSLLPIRRHTGTAPAEAMHSA
ncbi:MAG: ABC transporter permease [Spirochaetales bacterium]|nr:ABC transporter permease [Spirochaetales bacterium]